MKMSEVALGNIDIYIMLYIIYNVIFRFRKYTEFLCWTVCNTVHPDLPHIQVRATRASGHRASQGALVTGSGLSKLPIGYNV